ncbi:MAG: hypothetical protein WCP34_00745 [Pseudomonadota bacterium]
MQKLNHLLKETPVLSSLMGQIDVQKRLMQQVERLMPPDWRGALRGVAPGEGGWTLLVDASVWASRLRLWLPELNEKTQQVWRVRVIAPAAPITAGTLPKRLNRPPPPHSQSLARLADSETEPRLRSALRRLAGLPG